MDQLIAAYSANEGLIPFERRHYEHHHRTGHRQKGLLEFVQFPFKLYRGDPNWVPPLIEERLDFFDPKKNPFYEHSRYQLFLARRDGELVGHHRRGGQRQPQQVHNEKWGRFGFFECIDDQAVADALLEAAEDWVPAQGMTIIRGPLNFSMNDEVGTLIDGFDEPPMVMMTYNPRYYPALIEGRGYTKAMDLYAWIYDIEEDLEDAPEKLSRVAEKAMQKTGPPRAQDRHEATSIRKSSSSRRCTTAPGSSNWGFVPMTDHEIDHLAASLKPMIDPNLIFIAETEDGKPVGVSLTHARSAPGAQAVGRRAHVARSGCSSSSGIAGTSTRCA